ncbi:MAG: AP2 domain-containing protein [Defluviitaleaceae bacterium]|nr:AP2 domain-containing protein [Defluviitaleaceae bacterium]
MVAVESAGYRIDGIKRKVKNPLWKFKCDCGNEKITTVRLVKSGKTKSCGCLHKESVARNGKSCTKDYTGMRFGSLVIIEQVISDDENARLNRVTWRAKCDCGNITEVTGNLLQRGGKKSCGCLKQNYIKSRSDKENKGSPFYGGSNVYGIRSKTINKNNTSGVKGVWYDKRANRWVAGIAFRGRTYILGYFKDLEEATKVPQQAEKMHFEPFIDWHKSLNASDEQVKNDDNENY